MIIGMGCDVIQIRRMDISIRRFGTHFLNRIFTPAEQAAANQLSADKRPAYYAKRFAAKEAMSKAIGSGIGRLAQWQEIETLNNQVGAPIITVKGQTAETIADLAKNQSVRLWVSLSDDKVAVATVIIETI